MNYPSVDINHAHTERGGRFYVGQQDHPTAELVYRMAGSHKMIIDHTEVDAVHEGHGVGRQLVAEAVKYAREHDIRILPICPFARSVMERTKEYSDVLITSASH